MDYGSKGTSPISTSILLRVLDERMLLQEVFQGSLFTTDLVLEDLQLRLQFYVLLLMRVRRLLQL